MPWDHAIDVERKLVLSRCLGDLTDEDLFNHQRQLAQDPLFNSAFSQLIDCRAVTSTEHVTARGIEQVARRRLYGPRSRRAIVAQSDVVFGLARMFENWSDVAGATEQIRVFTSVEEARAWLDVPPDEAA